MADVPGLSLEFFADDGSFPNSGLPVLIYRSALPADCGPEQLERLFRRNGWPPAWRDSVFTFHHYHSKSHECLGVAQGEATLTLGGPQGRDFKVGAGDVVVLPAGTGHRRMLASPDFMVVGAYPPGQEEFDTLRGNPEERPKADHNIAAVPPPESDPVGGRDGALVEAWR